METITHKSRPSVRVNDEPVNSILPKKSSLKARFTNSEEDNVEEVDQRTEAKMKKDVGLLRDIVDMQQNLSYPWYDSEQLRSKMLSDQTRVLGTTWAALKESAMKEWEALKEAASKEDFNEPSFWKSLSDAGKEPPFWKSLSDADKELVAELCELQEIQGDMNKL